MDGYPWEYNNSINLWNKCPIESGSILTQSPGTPAGGLLWFPSCGRRGPPKAKHCLDAPGKKKWRGFGWFFLTTWWYSWFISGLSLAGYIP